jgi:hypothetical protein
MDEIHTVELAFMRESYERWAREVEAVESAALAAYKRKLDGDLIGMRYYMRHAREMMILLNVDITELSDEIAVYMLTYY